MHLRPVLAITKRDTAKKYWGPMGVRYFLKADFGVEQLIYRRRTVMKSNFAIP